MTKAKKMTDNTKAGNDAACIRINIAGDFTALRGRGPFHGFGKRLQALLSEADFNLVNFEGPSASGFPPTHKSGPSILQDAGAPELLLRSGFNLFSIANNHIMDYGPESALLTRKALGEGRCCGLGRGAGAFSPLYINLRGICVAVIAAAELQCGILHDFFSQSDDTGCAWLCSPLLDAAIREARSRADAVLLIAHAGLEGELLPLPEWRERYRQLIDEGCDTVIAGHTHTPQGYELYRGKPIFYSLGNFFFPSGLAASRYGKRGEIVSLAIGRGGIASFEVRATETDGHTTELINDNIWKDEEASLQALLVPENEYIKRVNEMCLRHTDDYRHLCSLSGYIYPDRHILRNISRWLLGRCHPVHMLNNLQCETHRWTFARVLRLSSGLK